jgi:cytochrome c553
MTEDTPMKKTLLILAAAALGMAPLAHAAKGNAEAGKAKSTPCAGCHGPDGISTVSSFPKLAGQHRDYLYHSLKDYKTGKRKNPIMAGQVANLSDADMADLAAYFAAQKGLAIKY